MKKIHQTGYHPSVFLYMKQNPTTFHIIFSIALFYIFFYHKHIKEKRNMKFIFSFLFIIVSLSSAFADQCPANSNNPSGCDAGCRYDADEGECVFCDHGTYNDGTFTNGCHVCATQDATTNEWTWSITPPTAHSIYDNDHATDGQSACPWTCDDGYYKNNAGDACLHCPLKPIDTGYNASTMYAIIQTHENQNNISQCYCGQNANLIKMDKPIPGQQTSPLNAQYDHLYFCGTCGTAKPAAIDASPIICDKFVQTHSNPAYGEEFDNNSIRMAYKCPDHATYNTDSQKCVCTSTTGAASADMECDYLSNTDTPCSCSLTCDESKHLVPSGNSYVCYCDYDYYGDANGCTRCPAGTVTYQLNTGIHYPGATVISECKMLHGSNTAYDVQFCTSDGNCMDLIPSNATITQPQSQ